MHKERAGSRRFAKGKSETMSTLEGLRDRGVKVDLGIPDSVNIQYGCVIGSQTDQEKNPEN